MNIAIGDRVPEMSETQARGYFRQILLGRLHFPFGVRRFPLVLTGRGLF
jgi:hypothetical protein